MVFDSSIMSQLNTKDNQCERKIMRTVLQSLFAMRHKRHPEEPYPLHDYIFFNPRDHKMPVRSFNKCFYKARKKASVPLLNMHGLRHYFISHCVMSGIEFFTIAKWVNHRNTRMIEEVYGHLSPDYRKDQMAMLNINGNGKIKRAT